MLALYPGLDEVDKTEISLLDIFIKHLIKIHPTKFYHHIKFKLREQTLAVQRMYQLAKKVQSGQ